MTDRTARGDLLRDKRLQAAKLFDAGWRVPQVSDALEVARTTVYSWHGKWQKGGAERLSGWRFSHPLKPLSRREAQVLDGLMLGDGCLWRGPHGKNPCLHVVRTARDLKYLKWSATVFKSRLTAASVRVRDVDDARTGKVYGSARLRTRHDPAFLFPMERWYASGKKAVPHDLNLTPLTIAVWFADDGSVSRASRRSPEIKFATHGFQECDVRRLAAMLSDRYGGAFPVYEESGLGQFTIRSFGQPAKALLRDIDPVFPPLARKSDRWRHSELLTEKLPVPPCPRCWSESVYRAARRKNGVQQFKCQSCMRVFAESYTRSSFDPQSPTYRELKEMSA